MGIENYSREELIKELKNLRQKYDDLENKVSKKNFQLTERNKELSGIYRITQLINDPDQSVDSVLQEAIKILANSYLYPDISCGMLIWDQKEFITDNFEETPWKQSVRKELNKTKGILIIEIYYLKEMPSLDEGPFLNEERNLLETVAQELAVYLKRKLAEEQTSLNAQKFESVFNSVQDAIFIHDFEGNFLEVNDEACRRLNYNKDKLLTFKPMDIDKNSYAKIAPRVFKDLNVSGRYKGETIHITKDGTQIPTELNANKILFRGKPAILTVARNITERKEYEKELLDARNQAKESEALTKKSLANIQFLAESAMNFIDNSYEHDIYTFIGKKLNELNPKAHIFVNEIDYDQGIIETKSFESFNKDVINETLKNTGIQPIGQKYPYSDNLLTLSDGKVKKLDIGIHELTFGQVSKEVARSIEHQLQLESIYGVAFMLDQKIYANAFFLLPQDVDLQNIETIEGFVNIASLALKRRESDKKLIQAKEKAEENDRLKTAFLHNLSHEIRTPLNAILGFLDLLDSDNIEFQKKLEFIHYTKESGNKLLSIINDILDVSFMESNQIQLDSQEFSINNFLEDLGSQFKTKIETSHKNIDLKTHKCFSDGQDIIVSDPDLVHKIYSKLIDNSLKFTNEGFIEMGYKADGKENVVFYVRDTGIGVPNESKELIFERFRQLDDGMTRQFEGLGLGLSIAQGLVERLGGTIEFHSEENEGTTVLFKLPVRTREKQSSGEKNKDVLSVDLTEGTILVAEDDITNYSLIEEFLSDTKANIEHAENGSKAIDLYKRSGKIDLILMDIKMPVLDGIEAFKEIKKLNSHIPIIALTAYAYENDKKRLLDKGFDGYISKPVDQKDLIQMVEKVMADKQN